MPLVDVPILGGSHEQVQAARDEMLAFDEAVGPGRVEIVSVTFKPLDNGAQGRFNSVLGRIYLGEDLDIPAIRRMVRHELCHVLDYQEGLLDRPTAPFDEFGSEYFDPEEGLSDRKKAARGRRSEALAQVCEIGPFGATALSSDCPGDDPLAVAIAGWISQNVWLSSASSVPWDWPDAVASTDYAPHGEWDGFTITPTVVPDRIGLQVGYPDVSSSTDVDIYTGEPAPGAPEQPISSVQDLPGNLPFGGDVSWGVGWADGPAGASIAFPITGLDEGATRLIASNGETWGLVDDGCLNEDTRRWSLFTADDRVWYAWGDGLTVSWGPIEN